MALLFQTTITLGTQDIAADGKLLEIHMFINDITVAWYNFHTITSVLHSQSATNNIGEEIQLLVIVLPLQHSHQKS